jgi:hypothetical protein
MKDWGNAILQELEQSVSLQLTVLFPTVVISLATFPTSRYSSYRGIRLDWLTEE